jgi:RNA polymerase sigma factor (sigma-70 family)
MKGADRGIYFPEMESLIREGVAAGLPDRDLLARFVSSRDRGGELAFTVLVARHGPMVLGVCRRFLRDPTEADDAFQATFLVLARKAGSIRLGNSLGPWLHGVSVRVARRLQAVANRAMTSGEDGFEWLPDRHGGGIAEVERRLEVNDALDALPVVFAAAIRLCYLEGLTHEEAAARLGCPVGTVRSRLARGRALLRHAFEDARILPSSPSPAVPAAKTDGRPFSSSVAPALVRSTARAAARVAAGHPWAGVVPARVAELATGVIATMSRTKLVAAVLVALGSLAGWGAWAAQSGLRARENPSTPAVARGSDSAQEAPTILLARTEASADGTDFEPSGQREIDQPPSDRLRGDFDPKIKKRRFPAIRPSDDKPAPEFPAEFPAFVVETVPKLGDLDVDPATTKEIRVVFSKPMTDKSWSWTSGNAYATPKSVGPPHYLPDHRTCVLPVKLEPDTIYVIGFNGGRFEGFKAADGKSALGCTIAFRTRAAK